MPTLTAAVGLPGSGKTTWAKGRQLEAAAAGALLAVVERDRVRDTIGFRWDWPTDRRAAAEHAVTAAHHAAVRALLAAGADVVVADTNLRREHLDALADIATDLRAGFATADHFLSVPLDVCVVRDALRPPYEPGGPCSGRSVGRAVIQRMWKKYMADGLRDRETTRT